MELIFQKDFENNADALKFERQLKRIRNKNYIRTKWSTYFVDQ